MNRVSDRIVGAMSTVKCPGCGRHVVPSIVSTGGSTTPTEETDGKRWSFVWVPPRGEVCPECDFPLSRYAGRLKWIRLFTAGVVLVTISFLLFVLAMIADFGGWLPGVLRVTGVMGLLALLIGLSGIIVGGRHGPLPGNR